MMASKSHTLNLSLHELLRDYADVSCFPDLQLSGLTSNSREVKKGNVFLALSGLTRHAIDFAMDAVKAGAVAIIYDEADDYSQQRIALLSKQLDTLWIPVKKLAEVSGEIASRFYHSPSKEFKLIGITGTDGKTSVTHLLVQIFNNMGKVAGSVGTLGYGVSNRLKMTSFTTPDAISLQSILFDLNQNECEYVVMEVSSHALEQYRVSGCDFDFAVLTNLGSDHLDYHGDHSYYAAAKERLFDMESLSSKVLNVEDEFGRKLTQKYKGDAVTTYSSNLGRTPQASVQLISSGSTEQGLNITAIARGMKIQIQTRLIGSFNIDNLLACISVLQLLGFEREAIEKHMQGLQPIPGRMEYFAPVNHYPAVVIDFAHTEQALKACLKSVKNHYKGQLYCVFGCGGDRDQSKRPKMAAVAERLADHVFVTEDNPRFEPSDNIMKDILSGFKQPHLARVIHDRQTAIETAIAQAGPDDLVVIAGKGHEQIQIVKDKRLPFSDHYVVRNMLGSSLK